MTSRIVTYGTSLSAETTWFWRRAGGSWVAQVRTALETLYEDPPTLLNRARWGSDSDWGLESLRSRVLDAAPDMVTLEFAVNDADVTRSIPLDRSRRNVRRMIREIGAARPECGIVLLTTNPVFGRYRRLRPVLEDYYQAWRDVADEHGLPLIDLYALWVDALREESARRTYLPDGIHPSREGCRAVIVPTLIEAFRGFLERGSTGNRM